MRRSRSDAHALVWRTVTITRFALVVLVSAVLASPAVAAMELAVTVDDLPTHGPLPRGMTRLAIAARMIQALKRHGAPGVYGFTNGGQLRDSPELQEILLAWRHAGFLLGNHTFSHVDLARVSAAEYIIDIQRNEELLARLSPPGAPRYFRYPYLHDGDTRDKREAVRGWLAARGYTIAPVTVSVEDHEWNDVFARCVAIDDALAIARLKGLFLEAAMSRLAAFEELSRRLFKRPIKHILLLHMSAFGAAILDELLTAYRAAGTRFISFQEAVQDSAYTTEPALVQDAGPTFLIEIAHARNVPIPGSLLRSPRELAQRCRDEGSPQPR